ncbi:MAG: glucose/arabinose dehydrogenase [Planctomycetota bacterium]|jgi:glucose/arabinose dehydrogenase
MKFPFCTVLTALLFSFCANSASAQTPLTTELVVNGLNKPVEAIGLPGDPRIFIVEQNTAQVRVFDGTNLLAAPLVNVKSLATTSGNEQGLLGLAFHPNFGVPGAVGEDYFYINYTRSGPSRSVVDRFTVSPTNPNIAINSSRLEIMSVSQPFSNHNGGCLRFGSDGYLYIGWGDGGSANDPQCRAQNGQVLLGKMLRIDVDGGSPYAIPPSNPFVGDPNTLDEIWSTGLRNPWRYAFDALTGELFIGDVGQNAREEINVISPSASGINFGWKMMEGFKCNSTTSCGAVPACNSPALTLPVSEYSHGGFGGRCSITGGEVYRGCKIPDLFGTYFYADYCNNDIFSFDYTGGTVNNGMDRTSELAPGGGLSIGSITSFGVDGDGEILIVDQGGEIFRVIAAVAPAIADCDNNGKDDICEITMNPSLDMNGNGVLDSCDPTCGFTSYGVGASPANYLVLAGGGSSSVGGVVQANTSGALGSITFNVVSLGQNNLAVFGGVVLVNQAQTIINSVQTVVAGNSTWSLPIPAGPALIGLDVFFQSASPDGSQPSNWAFSNGLKLTICP